MAMTKAERISRRLNGDGERFQVELVAGEKQADQDPEGEISLDTLALRAGASVEKGHDIRRYIFSDGSVITSAVGGWDFGFRDCWCWQGAGHREECEAPSQYRLCDSDTTDVVVEHATREQIAASLAAGPEGHILIDAAGRVVQQRDRGVRRVYAERR